MILKGYIDESYGPKQNVFSFSCLIARGKDWGEMERKWKLHLAAKNKELARAKRPTISRYHASDCSGCHNEFEGWTRDERDAFVLKLFGLFRGFHSKTVVYDAQMDHVCEIFPEWKEHRLEAAYYLLTSFLIFQIGMDFKRDSHGETVKLTLFHDQTGSGGKYDATILRSFNQKMNDPTFEYKDYFTTIAPLKWQDSIALQPADLVAFECFKEAEARIEARKSRRSYKALLDMELFGIHSMSFNKRALTELRRRMIEQQELGLVGTD